MELATTFSKNLIKYAKNSKIKLLKKPHRFAGFAVLKSPKVPSVLIETGYMSNKYDVKNLKNKSWQNKISKVIMYTLDKYFKDNPI